jgi:hypothetical protein
MNATLIHELLEHISPMDTARCCGSHCEEGEDLLLHVLTEFALLLACTGVEQAHVHLAHGWVQGRCPDGIAHEMVCFLHIAQLNI